MSPLVPIGAPLLWPFHHHAPLVWLSGLVCLWLTRYTHQFARRWGRRYYPLCALTSLITYGPCSVMRHPQFLSAIGVVSLSRRESFLVNPILGQI